MSSRIIGVRLESGDFRAFSEKAKRLGVKPSVYLRSLILSDLDSTMQNELFSGLTSTLAELQVLRKELSKMAVVLLVDAGKCKPSEARTWVIENLGHPTNNTPR